MSEQECISGIGVIHRTRFVEATETWYAEAPLQAMVKLSQENGRLGEEIARLRGVLEHIMECDQGWNFVNETSVAVIAKAALEGFSKPDKPTEIEITHIKRRIPRYDLPDDQSSGWTSKELLVLNDLIDHAKDFAAECAQEHLTTMAGCWKTTADALTELRDGRGR